MPVLAAIRERFERSSRSQGDRISACLHVTTETANLMETLKAGGAEVVLCASNPLSTQDDVAAALVERVRHRRVRDQGRGQRHVLPHIEACGRPQAAPHDGRRRRRDRRAPLARARAARRRHRRHRGDDHGRDPAQGARAPTASSASRSSRSTRRDTKHLFDNRYGTGQSTIDGIIRATNVLLAGKRFVVAGYGWCGRGVAMRARGHGRARDRHRGRPDARRSRR